jgi:hypothetical protein
MSTLLITGPCIEAARLFLADNTKGFNPLVAGLGFTGLAIDWNANTSKQFFEINAHPDDFEDSAPFAYPMCFLHGISSNNAHEQFGVRFSGRVDLALRFYATTKAPSIAKAGRALEAIGHAIEGAVNTMFSDGNWPQSYGLGAVFAGYPMTREPIEKAGDEWRQGFTFRLTFDLTAS